MKNKFTAVLGSAVLLSVGQIALAQMGATPALHNNWSYPTSPSPEQVLQNGLQPVQNAMQQYVDRQNQIAAMQAAEANAERLQQDADAAAQALQAQQQTQLQLQGTGYPTSDSPKQATAWDDYVKLYHPELAQPAVTTPSTTSDGIPKNPLDVDPNWADKWTPPATPSVIPKDVDDLLNHYLATNTGAVTKPRNNDFDRQEKLAENGNAAAQRFQGIYYLGGSGDGTPNYAEAAKWFRKAAGQNDAFSELCLGDLYADGNGVPRDYSEALKWYRNAADQGNAVAQYNLGCYYEFGKGVAKDEVEAARWFRKAADQGNVAAQYSLGYCYCKGEGVEANAVEGYKWFNLASAQGNEPAKKILTILEQKMTPEQIAEAQRLSMAFQPQTKSAATNSN